MGDFDRIQKQTVKEKEQQLLILKQNEESIMKIITEEKKSRGVAGFLNSKIQLNKLAKNLEVLTISPENIFIGQHNDNSEEALKLNELKAKIKKCTEALSLYTAIVNGYDEENVFKTLADERKNMKDIEESVADIQNSLDSLMQFKCSETDNFNKIYCSVLDIQNVYSTMINGGLDFKYTEPRYDKNGNVIDRPDMLNGKKVHYINGSGEYAPGTDLIFDNVKAKLEREGDTDIKMYEAPLGQPLFTHDPCAEDVYQGGLGDCYFVSSLAALAAKDPDRIKNMIRMSDDGTKATVQLFNHKNEPVFVTVDAVDIRIKRKNKDGKEVDMEAFSRGASWVKLFERAYTASNLHIPQEKTTDEDYLGLDELDYPSLEAEIRDIKKNDKKSERYSNILNDFENPLEQDYINIRGGIGREAIQALLGDDARPFSLDIENHGNIFYSYFDSEAQENDPDRLKVLMEKEQEVKRLIEELNNSMAKAISESKEYEAKIIDLNSRNNGGNDETNRIKAEKRKWSKTQRLLKTYGEREKNYNRAMETVTAQIEQINNPPEPGNYTNAELAIYKRISNAFRTGSILNASTHPYLKDDIDKYTMEQFYTKCAGLPKMHAYSITYISKGDDGKLYIQVRDPHNAGCRKYDKNGNPYYDPDPKNGGISNVELRDFLKTFERVDSLSYDGKEYERKHVINVRRTKEIYSDAVKDICNQLVNAKENFIGDRIKADEEQAFNYVLTSVKELKMVFDNPSVKDGSIESSIKKLADAAKNYKDYCEDNLSDTKNLSGKYAELAANRYMFAEMATQLGEELKENQKLGKKKYQIVTSEKVREKAFNKDLNVSKAKQHSIKTITNIMEAKNKEEKSRRKELNAKLAELIDINHSAYKKKDHNTDDRVVLNQRVALIMYLDDVAANKDSLSNSVLDKKLSQKNIESEIMRSQYNIDETLDELALKDSAGYEAMLKKGDPQLLIKTIKNHWQAKMDALSEGLPVSENTHKQEEKAVVPGALH